MANNVANIRTKDGPDNAENSKQTYGTAGPQFYIHVAVGDLFVYSHDRSAYSAAGK
jgi:hypothetical protein